jgi:hypothetical protein
VIKKPIGAGEFLASDPLGLAEARVLNIGAGIAEVVIHLELLLRKRGVSGY